MHIHISDLGHYWVIYMLAVRYRAIIWTNVDLLSNWHIRVNIGEYLATIYTCHLCRMHLKMFSPKCWPFGSRLQGVALHHMNYRSTILLGIYQGNGWVFCFTSKLMGGCFVVWPQSLNHWSDCVTFCKHSSTRFIVIFDPYLNVVNWFCSLSRVPGTSNRICTSHVASVPLFINCYDLHSEISYTGNMVSVYWIGTKNYRCDWSESSTLIPSCHSI